MNDRRQRGGLLPLHPLVAGALLALLFMGLASWFFCSIAAPQKK